jgi:hypothetical protein
LIVNVLHELAHAVLLLEVLLGHGASEGQ